MKALFKAIRDRDTDKVIEILTKKPELVNCTAKAPPLKDDGQSPLQIAFKTKNFWAAKYLIEHGADVNFCDTESVNEWKMPVLHDALMALVAVARFESPIDPWDKSQKGLFEVKGVQENFNKVFLLIQSMVEKGSDVNSADSYGNTALMRVCMDIENRKSDRKRPLAPESIEDLKRIFDLLLSHGADIRQATPERNPVTEMYADILVQMRIAF